MRNLGSYPGKVAASSQAPWLALNVKESTGRLMQEKGGGRETEDEGITGT